MADHDEVLPMRGIIEDCSPAVTHKAAIITHHLRGETTAEIAQATSHTPRSVERYIRRFEQVRELVGYLAQEPEPATIARILGCSEKLVRTYLGMIPKKNGETTNGT
jgi:DNA-binding CsgD family transcriptional regulator